MKLRPIAAAFLVLALSTAAYAHRLDEYLQATMLSVEKDQVHASMRLVPGVAVASAVLAEIDSNEDGVLSGPEQAAYAERVLGDLVLTVDGQRLKPQLVSEIFPPIAQMKEGLGEIQLEFTAALPRGGPNRSLTLENHHQRRNAAYLVNCLVPGDRDIRIVAQTRNETQSIYRLDYVQAGASLAPAQPAWWTGWDRTGFASLFHLGMRHIAEGTDHLLFLLTLLLPAPLLVSRSASGPRWGGSAGARQSAMRIFDVVTAFTVGHSITLALAALEVVRVPSRPIEVLIAVSILVSAVHALRPLFPGKEAGIAAFFGLIHGLAFATTLGQLGLDRWGRVNGILAFNLGIETMQIAVVAVTLPSLVLLSRTRMYPAVRMAGAVFAGVAALGWIAERLFRLPTPVDTVVGIAAHHAPWIAAGLLLMGIVLQPRKAQEEHAGIPSMTRWTGPRPALPDRPKLSL